MATKFEVLLSAKLDENSVKDIQRQLDSISKGTTLKINADSSSVDKLKQSLNEVTNAANNAKKGSQGLDDIVGKFASWQVVGDVIHGVKNAMEDMVQQVFDLDESLVELEKVSGLSGSALQNLADDAFDVGERIGATGKNVIDATAIFAQAGYEAKDALDLGEQAIMLQNVSEAGATAAGSAQTLIAAMKAFNLESTQSNHIVDALNEVSNKYAVSVNDLSTAIQKSSASMAAGNNTLEQTFGLVTAGTEILQEPGRVANGLGTITARLTAKNDEYIKSITKGQGVLDAQTGELRSTYDILHDLSDAWEGLTSVEQQELAETVAGKTQRSLFTAIMTNFDSAVGATEAALNSEGSALEENAKRMNSLSGKVTQLQSAWQKLATDSINSDFVKNLIDIATNIVKLTDKLGGLPTILTAILGILLTIKSAAMVEFVVKMITSIGGLSTGLAVLKARLTGTSTSMVVMLGAMQGMTASEIEAAVATEALAAAQTTLSLAMAGITIVAVAAMAAVSLYKKNQEAVLASNKELSEQHLQEASDLETLKKSYTDLTAEQNRTESQNKKLSETIDELSNKYGIEKDKIDGTNGSREDAIKKIQEEINERKKLAATEKEASISFSEGQKGFLWGKDEKSAITSRDAIEMNFKLKDSYDLQASTISELQNKMTGYITTLENTTNRTKEQQSDLETLQKNYSKLSGRVSEFKEGYQQAYDNLKEGIPITTDQANALYQLGEITLQDALWIQKYNETEADKKEQLWEVAQNMISVIEVSDEYISVTGVLTSKQKEMQDTLRYTKEELDAINKEIDDTQSAYNTLTTAVDEYNSSGGISMDTLQELLSLDGDYLNSLELVNGQLQISGEAQSQHAARVQEDTMALIESAAMNDLQAMASEGAASAAANAAGTIYNAGENAKKAGDFAKEGAAGFRELAAAMSEAGMVDTKAVDVDAWANKWSGITEKIKGLTSGAGITGSKFTGGSGGGKKSKGGGGGSKKSAASTKEEYKAEIDLLYGYKNALDIAKDSVDRYKDALKSTENFKEQEKYLKKLIDATNNQINKTNELKNAQTGQINDYINQLRAQGFAIDYNNSTNELYINNMQHLADFSGDTAKNLEKLIKKIQDLNDDNRSLDGSVRDLTDDVKDYYDQLADIPEKKLKKFKELMEDFQQSRLDQVENQIQDIEHDLKNDERLKALQDQIDALEKQKEELEDQETIEEKLLAVEEAKIKLANAQKQKTLQVYREGQGFVWEADPDAIADAAEELADAQKDLNDQVLQDQIDNLQAEYDAIEKSYQDRIDALQDFLDEQNYIIDKSNREGIQSFEDLQAALRKYGLDSAEYLGQATDWLNNYNNALSNLDTTVNGILANSSAATDGLIYSSNMQDRINQALSTLVPSASPITGLTLSNIDYDRLKGSDNQTIYVNSIELPNVQNVDDFVAALKDLPRMATTQVTKRT